MEQEQTASDMSTTRMKRKNCCDCTCEYCGNEDIAPSKVQVLKIFVCSFFQCTYQASAIEDVYEHRDKNHNVVKDTMDNNKQDPIDQDVQENVDGDPETEEFYENFPSIKEEIVPVKLECDVDVDYQDNDDEFYYDDFFPGSSFEDTKDFKLKTGRKRGKYNKKLSIKNPTILDTVIHGTDFRPSLVGMWVVRYNCRLCHYACKNGGKRHRETESHKNAVEALDRSGSPKFYCAVAKCKFEGTEGEVAMHHSQDHSNFPSDVPLVPHTDFEMMTLQAVNKPNEAVHRKIFAAGKFLDQDQKRRDSWTKKENRETIHRDLKVDECRGLFMWQYICKLCDKITKVPDREQHRNDVDHRRALAEQAKPTYYCSIVTCRFKDPQWETVQEHINECHFPDGTNVLEPTIHFELIQLRSDNDKKDEWKVVTLECYDRLKSKESEIELFPKWVRYKKICDLCGVELRNIRLDHHMQVFHTPVKCEQCDFIAANKIDMKNHTRSAHRQKCEDCGYFLTAKEYRTGHNCPSKIGPGPPDPDMLQGATRLTRIRSAVKLIQGGYICMICGFLSDEIMPQRYHHLLRHSQYQCLYCPFKAISETALKKHMKYKHELVCAECNYSAKSTIELDQHVCVPNTEDKHKRIQHEASCQENGQWVCDICGYVARSSHRLLYHKEIHGPREKLQCPLCPITTATKGSLKTHMRIKHSNGGGFKCPFCDYKSALKHHIKLHIPRKHQDKLIDGIEPQILIIDPQPQPETIDPQPSPMIADPQRSPALPDPQRSPLIADPQRSPLLINPQRLLP